jgi:hypothetical protein
MNLVRSDKNSPGRAMVNSDINDGARKSSTLTGMGVPPIRQPHHARRNRWLDGRANPVEIARP